MICFRIFNDNSEITGIISNEDVVRSVEIFDILDNAIIDNIDSLTLPPHQRCAAHTLNRIATVNILAAENDGAYKRISRDAYLENVNRCLISKTNLVKVQIKLKLFLAVTYLLQMPQGIYLLVYNLIFNCFFSNNFIWPT